MYFWKVTVKEGRPEISGKSMQTFGVVAFTASQAVSATEELGHEVVGVSGCTKVDLVLIPEEQS